MFYWKHKFVFIFSMASFMLSSGSLSAQKDFDLGHISSQSILQEAQTKGGSTIFAAKDDIKINEFLALNIADTVDEAGQHEDWIELYNTTGSPQNLYGLYLTDLFSNPTKYAFPPNTIIQAYGLLVLFLDQDSSTSKYLHCNFKLSGSGEMLMLSDGNGVVSDSITFGVQTTDVSLGRCPNGTGMFSATAKTTFNASNCGTIGIIQEEKEYHFRLFPNPAQNSVTIQGPGIYSVSISDVLGNQLFLRQYNNVEEAKLNYLNFGQGIYYIRINDQEIRRLQVLN
ncbi:MAG: lamin tail domain-containing protein [Bacteroidetes bacterium]|nr:lamin tail domain-containing protein [Bacteroidota bacterium]